MKAKKLISSLVVAAVAANMVIAGAAMAADDAGTATLELTNGDFVLSIGGGGAIALGTQNVSISDQTFQSAVPTVTFGDEYGSARAFTLKVKTAPLSDGTHTDIPYTNIKVKNDVDASVAAVGGSDLTGVTLNAPTNVFKAFAGAGGESSYEDLVNATSLARVDQYTVDPQIEYTIPGGQEGGTYTATVTFTII